MKKQISNKLFYITYFVLFFVLSYKFLDNGKFLYAEAAKKSKNNISIEVFSTNYCFHKPKVKFRILRDEKILPVYNQWRGNSENIKSLKKVARQDFFVIRDYFTLRDVNNVINFEVDVPHVDFERYMLFVAIVEEIKGFIPIRALGLVYKPYEQRYNLILDTIKIKDIRRNIVNWLVVQIPKFEGDLDVITLGNVEKNEPDRIPIFTIYDMSQKRTLPLIEAKEWYAPERLEKATFEKRKKSEYKGSKESKINTIIIKVSPYFGSLESKGGNYSSSWNGHVGSAVNTLNADNVAKIGTTISVINIKDKGLVSIANQISKQQSHTQFIEVNKQTKQEELKTSNNKQKEQNVEGPPNTTSESNQAVEELTEDAFSVDF